MRGGRGMGGGGGRGRGMGQGMGQGMGRGVGRGVGRAGSTQTEGVDWSRGDQESTTDEIADLKARAEEVQAQLQAIRERLSQIGGTAVRRRLVAVVETGRCTACGLCEDACPVGAITIDSVAHVDVHTCTGCRRCVSACPVGAITMQR